MAAFPKLTLIAVGKIKKSWIQDGLQVYQKRLPELTVVEVKDSDPPTEAAQILAKVKAGDRLIALSEDGETYDSPAFAHWLGTAASNSLVFAIGGPDGIDASLRQQASQILSLSPLTFPHELARLLLVEQLYRAKTILQGGRYHK